MVADFQGRFFFFWIMSGTAAFRIQNPRWVWEMEPYQKLACEGDNAPWLCQKRCSNLKLSERGDPFQGQKWIGPWVVFFLRGLRKVFFF